MSQDSPNPPSLWSALLDLVAPKECGGCGRPPLRKTALCGPCTQALTAAGAARRAVLEARAVPRTHAAGYYEDPLRTMLIHYKERARSDLGRMLGVALAGAVLPSLDRVPGLGAAGGPLLLVPMPSSRSAVRRRGADTTAQLARHAARALRAAGVPVRSLPALRHTRRIADQAGLDRAERAANLAGALRVTGRRARDLVDADVVLVDDIATTGSTLAEGARAVRAGGARVVGAATVAAARLRS